MKAAIFDLDGTLIDSTWVWENVSADFLKSQGIEPPEDIDSIVSTMSFKDSAVYFVDRFHLSLTPQDVMDFWYRSVGEKYHKLVPAKPFAREYLHKLQQEGTAIYLVTATHEHLARGALERLDMLSCFNEIITVDTFGKSKRFPDIFLHCAALAGAAPGECVVFEDSLYAIQTARQAGFSVCAVADPNARQVEEIRRISNRYIQSYAELL